MLQTLSDTVRATIRAVRRREIESLIHHYSFPNGLRGKVAARLGIENDRNALDRILLGLKEYFLLCLDGRDMVLGMPSKAVDTAWHEFILYTRDYTTFCQRVYGGYLHHMPNETPGTDDDFLSGAGRAWMDIGRTWILCCMRSGQHPRRPRQVPLLFAIDAELGISGGEVFTLNDLADLPIPPGFIEITPGQFRYIKPRVSPSRHNAFQRQYARKGYLATGGGGCTGSVAGGGCGGGHGHGGCGGGHGGGGGCGGGGCGGGGGG